MQANHRDFSAAAREALRAAVARLARAATSAVSIEGVRRLVQKDSAAGIVVRVCVETGPDVLAAHAVLTALQVRCSPELVPSSYACAVIGLTFEQHSRCLLFYCNCCGTVC